MRRFGTEASRRAAGSRDVRACVNVARQDQRCGPSTIVVVNRVVLGAAVVLALAGCGMAQRPGAAESSLAAGASTEPSPTVRPLAANTFVLIVTNLDGPQANVLIGDRKVATLNCWDHPMTFTPGDPGLPPIPWTVTILDISHTPTLKTLGARTEAANGPPDMIVIRPDHIETGPASPRSGAPIASCPPAPSAEPMY